MEVFGEGVDIPVMGASAVPAFVARLVASCRLLFRAVTTDLPLPRSGSAVRPAAAANRIILGRVKVKANGLY